MNDTTNKLAAFPGVEIFEPPARKPLGLWPEECQVIEEESLVEGLIPAASLCSIFGRRGSAKTFLAIEVVTCGALGQPFFGNRTERFGSVYCVGEKKGRFGKRVRAMLQARGLENSRLPIVFRDSVPNLLDEAEVEEFIELLNDAKPEFQKRGAPLKCVVFDTLARALKHKNVSDADAAGSALEAIQRIIDRTGVTVIPLAHVAKTEGSSTQKGAGEWEDAADALLRIDRDGQSAVRTVTLAKQSDEADGAQFAFELDVVELGETKRGRLITSCVVRQVPIPEDGTDDRAPKLNAPAQLVMTALDRLETAGQTVPVPNVPGARPDSRGVNLSALRQQTYDLGLQMATEPPADAPETVRGKWMEARKKAFQRAVERVCEVGLVRQEGDLLWRL